MFEPIRRKLLLSYLGVLAGILLIFSFAVRSVFIHSLKLALIEELELLAKSVVTTTDFQGGIVTPTDVAIPVQLAANNQALEWFDAQGQSLAAIGKNKLESPIVKNQWIQEEEITYPDDRTFYVISYTIEVFSDENTDVLTGYVRASQSLGSIRIAVDRLDRGLLMGSFVALFSAGFGGLWLMRQSMQPIEESFDQLKQFTADASHELRSPLMAISSNAKVALKYDEGMRTGDRDKFESIQSASSQMSQLAQDLLFLARTEKIPKHQQVTLDLRDLLEELVQLYRPEAQDKGVQLWMTCRSGIHIRGDKNQLNRLLTNLLVNALHHTPKGGLVSLEGKALMKQVMIQVKDTGGGIAPEQLTKVFNRFWRAETARTGEQGRSGLGLAIAQAIVKAHQGSITVNSKINQGSCFTVKLPMTSVKKSSPAGLPMKV